jgi:Protein of unknown function (DUF1302)
MSQLIASRPSSGRNFRRGICIAAGALAMSGPGTAVAFTFDTGNPDLQIFWDNTVRLNLGWRVEDIDDAIGDAPFFDESDYRFEQGDMITQRIDLLSEVDIIWKRDYGARLSVAAWYDHAYRDTDVQQNPAFKAAGFESSYFDNEYSDLTENYYHGPYGEVLDAFVFAHHNFGQVPVSVRAGQFSTFWGMSLFYISGIAQSQQPLDGRKGAATPGTEVKELFLPLTQVNVQAQITPTFAVEAQYYLDWENTRAPEGGTFLSQGDFGVDGPDQLGYLGPAFPNLPRASALEPEDDHGAWGVKLQFNPDFLQGQTLGVYYREFAETAPWTTVAVLDSGLAYRFAYADEVKLAGVSFDGAIGAVAVGAEVGYHMDTALKTPTFSITDEGARGDTWHALVNAIYLLPQTKFWDTGTVAAELTYDRLDSVNDNEDLFLDDGTVACEQSSRPVRGEGDSTWGCATKDAWGFGIAFAPKWLQVLPGLDVSVPLKLTMGLEGNSAVIVGVNEDAGAWSVAAELQYKTIHFLSLSYADNFAKRHRTDGLAWGGNGAFSTTDRGRINLTYKVSF